MRKITSPHIFMDMDETLLKGKYIGEFHAYDFIMMTEHDNFNSRREACEHWNEHLANEIEAEKAILEQGLFQEDHEYMSILRARVMRRRVEERGWKVIALPNDESIAVFPRPHVKEFLEEVSKIGTLCLCSTAVSDYACAALTEVLDVAHMFNEICTRHDIYPQGPYFGAERGWECGADQKAILVDDLPYGSDGISSKMRFLGFPKEDRESRLVKVRTFDGWNDKDSHLMDDILPEIRRKMGV
jgi:phosphoglycolate phosphatase-like HAD superfamily hydrolase